MIYRVLALHKSRGYRKIGIIQTDDFHEAERAGKDWVAKYPGYDFIDCKGLSAVDVRSKVVEVT
jgi:hypothetical protein